MAKQEYNYFEEFINLSKFSFSSAEILCETLKNYNSEELSKKLLDMHNIEHSADIAKHDMMNRLAKEFVPPIEREDIVSLSQNIDDVTDAIEDILIRMDMFNVKEIKQEVLQFAALIESSCDALTKALGEFKNFKKSKNLQPLIIEINRLEEEGDHLYTDAVRTLFRTSTDPVELMVWSEILERFEKCCDACEAAANDIESIVMKNS